MPIPEFDRLLNILPPHSGDPTAGTGASPYSCRWEEVVSRFGATDERLSLLDGLLRFRKELRSRGIFGFQWLDGSFVEDCEQQRGRPLGDTDVVTFIDKTIPFNSVMEVVTDRQLRSPASKDVYHVDSYFVYLRETPRVVIRNCTYWYGLFSHRRDDALWKGMLEIPLELGVDDVLSVREKS